VAFLTLSVAVKSDHYELLREARVLRLKGEFRAKLGSLTGGAYSAVGTHDWYEELGDDGGYSDFVSKRLDDLYPLIWVPNKAISLISKERKKRKRERDADYEIPEEEVLQLLDDYASSREKKIENIADACVDVVARTISGIPPEKLEQVKTRIVSDSRMLKLLS